MEYIDKIKDQIDKIYEFEKENIEVLAKEMARCIIEDKIIHVIGTGHSHMIGLELFIRAGGLANVNCMLDSVLLTADGAVRSSKLERVSGIANILWEEHGIVEGDMIIVISNSGRNALPIEMAMLAKENNISLTVITSLLQSKKYPSRHTSGKKLYEFADILIDNHVPSGDGFMTIGDTLTGAVSSISGMTIVNTASTEAMKIAYNNGVKLPIYGSQNIDESNNDNLYKRYKGRIKHM